MFLSVLSATAADQQPKDRNWQLRFGAVVLDPTGTATVYTEPGSVVVGTDLRVGGGVGVSLERRLNELLGIEFGFTAAGFDFGLSVDAAPAHAGTSLDMLTMAPFTVGANFHLVQEGPVDVYVGPLFGVIRYSELTVRTDTGHEWPWWPWGDAGKSVTAVAWSRESSEFTWGARLGTGIAFGKRSRWSAQLSLTYMDATLDLERDSRSGAAEVTLDPLMFSFGLGWKF
jgi:outer membrane protein W